ncbi:hypothetical protein F441_13812 [Phytophthora nicotianae CJ01A1]|uniref:DDE-1 domain-containing protein n=2 Tax=Phytophthora nicotianae TaxID=4792 RepID=W2YUQ7_PHYNI|nr:hypothetical protein F441_13812 [Phytophthora nicotianae CJ01A1]ETP38718.1 hypothetical protein F442_13726 [Phytophthora nicotianae P10297]
MTAHLQPADYAWFKPLKANLMESIDEWKLNGDFDYIRGENVKNPRNTVVLCWLTRAWKAVSVETIVTSIRRCFLGADANLALRKHSIYGEVFKGALKNQRADADLATSVEADQALEEDSDSDDGNDVVVSIAELTL